MQGSSAFQFARAARAAGLMSRRRLISDAAANLRFRLKGSTDADTHALRDRIASQLTGVRVIDMERLAVPVLARILPRLYPQMLEIAYGHQDAGRPVYIVTAAAEELAATLATVMGFDGGLGSHLSDASDGIYTGRSDGEFLYREAKAEAIRQLAGEHGFALEHCWAYSDSASDLPMLETVGHAVVVSPDAELAALARQRGWQVLRLDPLKRRLGVLAGAAGIAAAAAAGVAGLQYNRAARARRLPPLPLPRRLRWSPPLTRRSA